MKNSQVMTVLLVQGSHFRYQGLMAEDIIGVPTAYTKAHIITQLLLQHTFLLLGVYGRGVEAWDKEYHL